MDQLQALVHNQYQLHARMTEGTLQLPSTVNLDKEFLSMLSTNTHGTAETNVWKPFPGVPEASQSGLGL